MSAPVVHDLDLDATPESELRRVHGIMRTMSFGYQPGDEPLPFEEWTAELRRLDAIIEMRRWYVTDGEDVVAFGGLELDRHRNTHVGWMQVAVASAHRRRGIGSLLTRRLVAVAGEDGRTSLGASAEEGSDGEPFLAGLGLTKRQTAHQNRLDVAGVDVGMLHAWVDRATERASGYSLRFWEGPTPDELVEPFAVCTEVMNSAPRGDLELDDERMTPARLRQVEAGRRAGGWTSWTLCAVHEATGDLVGFTQVHLSGWRRTFAKQGDTGVDPVHRDKGLGRWLKAEMLLRVLAERPAVERVETWNAGSNAPMLSINHALGFRLASVSGNWQGDLDVVRKQLDER